MDIMINIILMIYFKYIDGAGQLGGEGEVGVVEGDKELTLLD